MTDADNLANTAKKARREAERAKAEIDRERARYAGTSPETDATFTEASAGAARAAAYAAAVSQGGEEMLRLAAEELIIALQQFAAAVEQAGGKPDQQLPTLPHRHRAGEITVRREAVADDGQVFVAGPTFSTKTPYFFPGGSVGGRAIPRGWFSLPWWRNLASRPDADKKIITLALGAVAHEFYDKVIATMPDKPSTTAWQQGIAPQPTITGRPGHSSRPDDDTWWDALIDSVAF